MSEIHLPAGVSLRDIAEQLGVSVEELSAHTGMTDVEAPLAAERRIEIPDGFLRTRDRDRRSSYAAVPKTDARDGSANTVATLEIEYRRTRIAGGMRKIPPTEDELSGLHEARRAYLRLEADSNHLAADLYHALTRSQNVDVRAAAFAGEAIAWAQGHLIYGADPSDMRTRARSTAKAAIMADPQLPDAQLAMAMATRIPGGDSAAYDESRRAIERAVELGPQDPFTWTELGWILLADDDVATADEAATMALDAEPQCVLALELAGEVARHADALSLAEEIFTEAISLNPSYANVRLRLALTLHALEQATEARAAQMEALELANTDEHRLFLEAMYGTVGP